MEFYDVRPVGPGAAKPTIRTTGRTVLITIPNHLADNAGISTSSKVRVRFGESGRQRALQIAPAADGKWSVTRRRNVLQLFARQLAPKAPVALCEVDFQLKEGAIELALPTPWELADPHVLVRAAPTSRG